MTDEQIREHVAALIRERDMYRAAGDLEHEQQVEQELRKWAAQGEPPVKRATRR